MAEQRVNLSALYVQIGLPHYKTTCTIGDQCGMHRYASQGERNVDNRQNRRRNKKTQKANYRQLIQIAKRKRDEGLYSESELAFQEAAVADNTEAEPYHIMALMAYEDSRLEDAANHIIEATMRANDNP